MSKALHNSTISKAPSNGRNAVSMTHASRDKERLLKLLFEGVDTSCSTPRSTYYGDGMRQVVIGVGKDECATICLHKDALKYLGL